MKKLLLGIFLIPLGAWAVGEDRYMGGTQPNAPSQMGQGPNVTGPSLNAGDRDFAIKAASAGMRVGSSSMMVVCSLPSTMDPGRLQYSAAPVIDWSLNT